MSDSKNRAKVTGDTVRRRFALFFSLLFPSTGGRYWVSRNQCHGFLLDRIFQHLRITGIGLGVVLVVLFFPSFFSPSPAGLAGAR